MGGMEMWEEMGIWGNGDVGGMGMRGEWRCGGGMGMWRE